MIDASFVKAIQESSATQQFAIADENPQVVFSEPVHRPPLPMEPRIQTIDVASLTGLIEVFNCPIARPADHAVYLQIVSPTRVVLADHAKGVHRQRDIWAAADCASIYGKNQFRFGEHYSLEDFIISLRTLFEPSPEVNLMAQLLASITSEDVRKDDDNGLTQVVEVRSGISMKSGLALKNPWLLAPYRTFRDVVQPASSFILRLKMRQGDMPMAVLHQADGEEWKLDAIKYIKLFFAEKLPGVAVVG